MFERRNTRPCLSEVNTTPWIEQFLFGQDIVTYLESLTAAPQIILFVLQTPVDCLTAPAIGLVSPNEKLFLVWLIICQKVLTVTSLKPHKGGIFLRWSRYTVSVYVTSLFIKHLPILETAPEPTLLLLHITWDIIYPQPLITYVLLPPMLRISKKVYSVTTVPSEQPVMGLLIAGLLSNNTAVFLRSLLPRSNHLWICTHITDFYQHNLAIERAAYNHFKENFWVSILQTWAELKKLVPNIWLCAKHLFMWLLSFWWLYIIIAGFLLWLVLVVIWYLLYWFEPWLALVDVYTYYRRSQKKYFPPELVYPGNSIMYEFPWVIRPHVPELWTYQAIKSDVKSCWRLYKTIICEERTRMEESRLRFYLTTGRGSREMFFSGNTWGWERHVFWDRYIGSLIEDRWVRLPELEHYLQPFYSWRALTWGYRRWEWTFSAIGKIETLFNFTDLKFIHYRLAEIKAESVIRYLDAKQEWLDFNNQ
jgi:hypothetical protein